MKRFAHQLKVEIIQSVIYPLRRKQSEHDMVLPCSASFHASDFFFNEDHTMKRDIEFQMVGSAFDRTRRAQITRGKKA